MAILLWIIWLLMLAVAASGGLLLMTGGIAIGHPILPAVFVCCVGQGALLVYLTGDGV